MASALALCSAAATCQYLRLEANQRSDIPALSSAAFCSSGFAAGAGAASGAGAGGISGATSGAGGGAVELRAAGGSATLPVRFVINALPLLGIGPAVTKDTASSVRRECAIFMMIEIWIKDLEKEQSRNDEASEGMYRALLNIIMTRRAAQGK